MPPVNLNINDFRAMMGSYNKGDLVVGDDNKLNKINDRILFRWFRKTVEPKTDQNIQVRKAFYDAIESCVNSFKDGKAQEANKQSLENFLKDVREFLVGNDGAAKTGRLNREKDVAAILDKLDVVLAEGRYDESFKQQPNKTLGDRML